MLGLCVRVAHLLHDDPSIVHVGGWLSSSHTEVNTDPDPAVAAEAKEYTKDRPDDARLFTVVLFPASVVQATARQKVIFSVLILSTPPSQGWAWSGTRSAHRRDQISIQGKFVVLVTIRRSWKISGGTMMGMRSLRRMDFRRY